MAEHVKEIMFYYLCLPFFLMSSRIKTMLHKVCQHTDPFKSQLLTHHNTHNMQSVSVRHRILILLTSVDKNTDWLLSFHIRHGCQHVYRLKFHFRET
jgi:hypothetical protein